MTNKAQNIPTQAEIDAVKAAANAARLKSHELNDVFIKEQAEACAAEIKLEEADRAAYACLQESLMIQKKLNKTLTNRIDAMRVENELVEKEKGMITLMNTNTAI